MADSVVRLTVNSQEYDNKLKRATEGLTRYVDECRKVGGTLSVVEKDTLDYVRALGQMDTVSRTATGKLAEMKKTFTELSVVYNKLTDEEKQSPYGQAMAQSLQQLSGRIKESQSELKEIGNEMNNTGGIISQLTDKLTVNIDAFKLLNVGLEAAKIALGVVKDAFFKNEEQLDDWGRVVESSESLYSGFLDALNTGDISGYLNRIGEITRAAQNAYNALDALNTFNAFNQVNVEKTRTGMTESIADYRGGQGTKEQVKAAGEAYQKELRERQKLEKQAYLDAIKKVAAERGVNGQDLITALSGSYGSYESLKALPMSGSRIVNYGGGMFGGGGSYEEAIPANRQEKLGAALRKLNDTELQSLQALGAQAERTGNEIAQVDKQLTRVLNGRQASLGSGGGVGRVSSGVISSATNTLDYSDFSKLLIKNEKESLKFDPKQHAVASGLRPEDFLGKPEEWEKYVAAITESIGTAEESVDNLVNWTPDTDKFIKGQKKMTEAAKQNQMAMSLASQAVSAFGAAMAGMEDPGVRAAGLVMQSIASIALSFAQAAASPAVTGTGWGWLAFVAAGAAAMATTISTIHQLSGYEQGGIVKGNSYSGDNIMANGGTIGLNAGELVLTKAMQGNLASQMQGGGLQNMNIAGRIKGTDIILSIDRSLKLEGKQLLTWGR